MRKKTTAFVLCLILSGCTANASLKNVSGSASVVVEKVPMQKGFCEVQQIEKVIVGNSMSPLLHDGGTIDLLENYYKCGHLLEKNDIVAYHYGGEERPLIKIAKVLSDDEVVLENNSMLVNGEILKNSAGQDYHFSEGELKMLGLYIKDGHIPANTCFLFGDNTEVSTDSRKFGAVSPVDFLGKFVNETYEKPAE